MRTTRFVSGTIALNIITSAACFAQPSGTAVIDAVKARFAAVKDYKADVSISLKGPSMSVNNMRMTLFYKQPSKVRIEPKDGMGVVPPGNYFGSPIEELVRGQNASYLRSERRLGKDCHVLRLSSGAQPGPTLWVDKSNSTVIAVESTSPFQMQSTWTYARIDSKYFLPSEVKAEMTVPSRDKPGRVDKMRTAVRFSNYRVNKGIPDKLFQQKPKK